MNKAIPFFLALVTISACNVLKTKHNIALNEVTIIATKNAEREFYSTTPERTTDLIHTNLDVAFDWEKKHLLGKAYLDLKPYFHSQSSVTLDAKGFDIHQVAIAEPDGALTNLNYSYDDLKLSIQLDREYSREETYQIFIEYTAKPDDLEIEGGDAITDAKGLYFINPDNTQDKPQQIWTQGETESSSCWFPCIDKPNEKCSQQIAITVQEKYTTLSNGLLASSKQNKDGTRTDVWIQKQEHAPYLFMMAVGEFSITKDTWRGLPVNYYVEPEQEIHAQRIFGKTPEMMEFYSELLGFEYPWEKYAQIIVRDYVSGAMENTTAVIHGEFVYSDERSFIDDPNEMIIAHELFHHWFGDWVTCESWPNLPLNEGFATYGEYLWMEGKYTANEAQHYLHQDLIQYLNESSSKQVNLIRFDNENPNDMFDNHSYAKGGRILHMLRHTLGDEAFFKGLEHYLSAYANQAVEVHHLRLAMEHISGIDLNWFFNQWFLASGHPQIEVTQEIEERKVTLKISQTQSLETTPLYKIPLQIAIHANGVEKRYEIELNKQDERFEFETKSKADLVVFDPSHYLLADISFNKSDEQWIHQLSTASHYYDKLEALDSLTNSSNFARRSEAVKIALTDVFWGIRSKGLDYFETADPRTQSTLQSQLVLLSSLDPKSEVRAKALKCLSTFFDQDENMPGKAHAKQYIKSVKDPSYIVAGEALKALNYVEPKTAYKLAKKELAGANEELKSAVLNTIAKNGALSDQELLLKEFEKAKRYATVSMTNNLLIFLEHHNPEVYMPNLEKMRRKIDAIETWYVKYYALNALKKYGEKNLKNIPFYKEVFGIYSSLISLEKDERIVRYLLNK